MEVSMFKVGDKVVYETYAIHKIMDESGDGFFELSNFAYVHFSEIRHATPEEIAAGHRIDCKKFDERVK